MDQIKIGQTIEHAREAAGMSQRALADQTGISQPTLSRIVSGQRAAKIPELVLIAEATGRTLGQLTGTSASERVQFAARATNGTDMSVMRDKLLSFVELSAYLDDYAIEAR